MFLPYLSVIVTLFTYCIYLGAPFFSWAIFNIHVYGLWQLYHIFICIQNVPVIFFSAAKSSKERKISEESDQTTSEKDNQHDSGAESADSDSEDEINEKEGLKSIEEDVELFKTQLGDLNTVVTNTAFKIDKIQEALDKVLENFRLGKPIEAVQSNAGDEQISNQKDEESSKNIDNNSYEIFNREKLLEVLKEQKIVNPKNPPRLTVGMIGYPNVGKSSTVNILMQVKKVSIFVFCVFCLDPYFCIQ